MFNKEKKLCYTGRAIDNPKNFELSTINNLENTLEQLLSGKEISVKITNPIGCNIKWKGKDKHWMPPEACDLI